jgi:hypothetical protein
MLGSPVEYLHIIQKVDYDAWPLVDIFWVYQDWNGNMILTDGVTKRLYGVKNRTITERPVKRWLPVQKRAFPTRSVSVGR